MPLPERLDLPADLLVDFLLDVVFSFVQHCNVVGEHCDFNLWTLSSVERRLPPLDEKSRYHHVIAGFDEVNEIVFQDDDSRPRDYSRLQSLVYFLDFDFLVVFVLGCPVHRYEQSIVAILKLSRVGIVLLIFLVLLLLVPAFELLHVLDVVYEGIWLLFDLATTDGWQFEPCELVDVRLGGVDLAALRASEIFLGLSIL